MLKLRIVIKLFILIALCSGCVTTNKYVGKQIPVNCYICHCQTLPAYGHQKDQYIISDYELHKLEDQKYLLQGTVRFDTTDPQWKAVTGISRLELHFALIKDNVVVDSVEILTSGDPSTVFTFKKSFFSKIGFNGITIIGGSIHGFG